MRKPRIWFQDGIWHCRGVNYRGVGISPAEAYLDYEHLVWISYVGTI